MLSGQTLILRLMAIVVMLGFSIGHAYGEGIKSSEEAKDSIRLSNRAFLLNASHGVTKVSHQEIPYNALMDIVMGTIVEKDASKRRALIEQLKPRAPTKSTIFQAYFELEALPKDELEKHTSFRKLVDTKHSKDWEERYLGQLLLSVIYLKRRDVLKGLETANISLESVPTDSLEHQRYTQLYYIYSVISNGFILDKSFDQALMTTEKALDFAEKAKQKPDAFSLSNNLAVLHSYRDEYETAIEIMKIGEPYLEKARPEQKVAFSFSIATFLVEMKQFTDATRYLEWGLTQNPPKHYLPHIYATLAIALSETGSLDDAKNLLNDIEKVANETNSAEHLSIGILRLKTKIAEKEGEYKSALKFSKAWAEGEIQRLKAEVRNDRHEAALKISGSTRLSNERMQRLETETELKDTIIDREKKARRFLTIIFGLVFSILLFSLVWLRREKAKNKEIVLAHDRAVASEQVKSRFLSVMSHEVRTPLNAIIPLSEQLARVSKDQAQKNLLMIINRSGEALLLMMENIMTLTNQESFDTAFFEEVNVHELVKNTLRSEAPIMIKKELHVKAQSKRSSYIVWSNKKALSRVLSNLISNAVKFTKVGTITISYGGTDDEMVITIHDTGIGFDVQQLPELLEPFVQNDDSISRSHEGAGIGLSVSHKLLQNLGGRMEVNSSVSIGTEVSVILPTGLKSQKLAA